MPGTDSARIAASATFPLTFPPKNRNSEHVDNAGVVARGVVVVGGPVRHQQRRFPLHAGPAALVVEAGEHLAAGTEAAARRRVGRAGQVAFEDDPGAVALLV